MFPLVNPTNILCVISVRGERPTEFSTIYCKAHWEEMRGEGAVLWWLPFPCDVKSSGLILSMGRSEWFRIRSDFIVRK